MTKKSLFSTKALVATALGAALFMVLFMIVKIPSPVPETNFQLAYGVSAFFGALFGPISGGLIAFIGHALNDFIGYGSPWWSWVFASLTSGLIAGLCFNKLDIENGRFNSKDVITFCVFSIVANIIAWVVVAPVLDIVIYSEPANLVFTQGAVACLLNAISQCVVGCLLCGAYAKTRVGKGSLDKE